MNNERILSHKLSRKLSLEDVKDVAAAGTTTATGHATGGHGNYDWDVDVTVDF